MSQTASQETQTSHLFKKRENCWTRAKKPATLNNLSVYPDEVNDNSRWSTSSIKINLIHTVYVTLHRKTNLKVMTWARSFDMVNKNNFG